MAVVQFSSPCSTAGLAFEYSDLGGDYRQRERVARKLRRWQNKLMAMSTREREAILRGLIDAASPESKHTMGENEHRHKQR